MRLICAMAATCLVTSSLAVAAPTIVTPEVQVDRNVPSSWYVDIGISGAAGEEVIGYDYVFSLTPDVGATGSISLTGNWAVPHPTDPLIASDPNQGPLLSWFSVSDAMLSGSATLSDTKYLFRLILDVSSDASGTFFINIDESFSTVSGIDYLPVPGLTFDNGSITVVPEPASVVLLGGVLGGLVLRRRR